MDARTAERDLYDRLSRTQGVEDWLQRALDREISTLLANPEVPALHRAQGAARVLKEMLNGLAAAKRARSV